MVSFRVLCEPDTVLLLLPSPSPPIPLLSFTSLPSPHSLTSLLPFPSFTLSLPPLPPPLIPLLSFTSLPSPPFLFFLQFNVIIYNLLAQTYPKVVGFPVAGKYFSVYDDQGDLVPNDVSGLYMTTRVTLSPVMWVACT